MQFSQISAAAAGGGNEDLVGVYPNDGFTDLLMLDGGTSVADRNYIDAGGDVVWLVNAFAAALRSVIRTELSQEDSVTHAIGLVHAQFHERAVHGKVPLYAWPIAAMTWIRVRHTGPSPLLQFYCLGDCSSLLYLPGGVVADLDPFDNPQEGVLQREVLRLRTEGVIDAITRRASLLPMLRARREAQNADPAPSILCLAPRGRFQARQQEVYAPPGAMLLMMSDGFYRLVDTYGLHSDATLAGQCLRGGLQPLLGQLRQHEQIMRAGANLSVKDADDASAISCIFPGPEIR